MEQAKGYTAIEELKEIKDTPNAVFEGVKATKGWTNGKMVTETEYINAVKEFETSPMDGRR